MTTRKILVTGASIAGPAVAYWLGRQGADVTVVERAPAFRDGGQTVDVRGAGRLVVQRMGLEEAVRAHCTGEEGIAFVDANNTVRARIGVEAYEGEGLISELEILRGTLGRILVEHSCAVLGRGHKRPHTQNPDSQNPAPKHGKKAAYRFGDSIAALEDDGQQVQVRFASGREEAFDLVIVAEGIGSHTRKLVFGEEVKRRPLNLYTAYFTIPRAATDGKVMRWYNAPGGRAVCVRPDNLGTTRAYMSFQEPPSGYEKLPPYEQKLLLKEKFSGAGWEVPRVLQALDSTPDFYLEAIGQVKMDTWSKGRVVLLGDAGYCASPISGMGTSLALCGAYVLAGELGRHAHSVKGEGHVEAFRAYENVMRPFVKQAQSVPSFAPRLASPHSRFGIALGHTVLRLANAPGFRTLLRPLLTTKAEAIDLPNYESAA